MNPYHEVHLLDNFPDIKAHWIKLVEWRSERMHCPPKDKKRIERRISATEYRIREATFQHFPYATRYSLTSAKDHKNDLVRVILIKNEEIDR